MRLIDADKLENDIVENITVKAVSRMLAIIQGQPTVKAIPIEWIEKYAKRFIELENRNYFAYRGFSDIGEAILYMLEDWEKENE